MSSASQRKLRTRKPDSSSDGEDSSSSESSELSSSSSESAESSSAADGSSSASPSDRQRSKGVGEQPTEPMQMPSASSPTGVVSHKSSMKVRHTDEGQTEEEHVQSNTDPNDGGDAQAATKPAATDPFEAWYVRTITQEFGDDLEKLRAAPDFKDSSVPILIHALKQGAGLFTEAEKATILENSRGT